MFKALLSTAANQKAEMDLLLELQYILVKIRDVKFGMGGGERVAFLSSFSRGG